MGEGGEQGGHVVLRGNYGAELAARQIALHGELPEGVDHQRHQGAEPERAGHFFGVAPEVVEQAGHVAMEAEGGEANGQGGAEVDPVAAVSAAGSIEQYGRLGGNEQAAVGPEEGHNHAADEDGGAAVYPKGGPPHAARKDEGKHNLAHPKRGLESLGGKVATGEDVGVGEQIEHKGHGEAGDDAPTAAEQVFNDGVEVGAGRIVGGGFENHQAAGEHGKPGVEQHNERAGKPDAGSGGGVGEHAGADYGASDNHSAAEYGGFLIHGDVGMEWVLGMVKALNCFLLRWLALLIAIFAARRRVGTNHCFRHTLGQGNETAAQISSDRMGIIQGRGLA